MVSWGSANPAWDAKILNYGSSFALAAYNNSGTLGFLPVQRPLVMEAMGFHPLATDPQKALVMKELTHGLILQAYGFGAGEIYFMGSDNGTNDFAERQGFRRVDIPMYRVRLADLETGGGNGSAT